MKVKLIILSIFTFFFLSIPTYALVNNSTQYNLTMHDYNSSLNNIVCGNETLKSVIDNFIEDFDDTYFDLFIATPNVANPNYQTINIYLVTKSSLNDIYVSGNYNSSPYVADYLSLRMPNIPYSSSFKMYKYQFNTSLSGCENTNFTDMQVYSNLVNAMETGISSASYDTEWSISRDYSNYTFDNNNDYDITDWFYYSSKPLEYNFEANSKTLNSSTTFYKSLHIVDNDSTYTFNNSEVIPSYYELYHSQEPDSPGFIEYNQLDTIYTNLGVSDFSNYSLSFNFNIPFYDNGIIQSTQDFVDNMSFNYVCSGRVDNTNYYSYESFPCSLTSSYSINDYNVSYIFNNLSTTQSLSNYDKLYVTLSSSFDSNLISNNISSFQYGYTLGSFLATSYKGNIYESFSSLPLNFKLYLSSNNSLSESSIYAKQYNLIDYKINYRGFSNTTNNLNTIYGSSILGSLDSTGVKDFVELTATNSIDTGIMIYQDNSSIPIPSLDLIFNSGIIISFNNSINSNDFYYIDNNGNIVNNTFNRPINNSDNSNYNISYYVSIVNNFIDDLSADSLEFANLTQSFYNGIPIFLQTFIFVVFILFCIYFTYLLIKK